MFEYLDIFLKVLKVIFVLKTPKIHSENVYTFNLFMLFFPKNITFLISRNISIIYKIKLKKMFIPYNWDVYSQRF